MRRKLITVTLTVVLTGSGAVVADTVTDTETQCYEDEVIMWNGDTDTHDTCVPLDDLTGQ